LSTTATVDRLLAEPLLADLLSERPEQELVERFWEGEAVPGAVAQSPASKFRFFNPELKAQYDRCPPPFHAETWLPPFPRDVRDIANPLAVTFMDYFKGEGKFIGLSGAG
jgi:hypothetical protein